MNWPLKIQGRFVTEAVVEEIRMLLRNHPYGIDLDYPVNFAHFGIGDARRPA